MISFPQAIRELACLPPSDSVMARALAANTAETITVPAGAEYVVFAGTADFYAAYGTGVTATVPGDTTDGSASELNPTMRNIKGKRDISVISAATCIVTAAFYGA